MTGEREDGQSSVQWWTDIVTVACGNGHVVGVREDGSLIAAGRNDSGQCDLP